VKTIVEIVEEAGISLKKMGSIYQGLCPFHEDLKTPSFTVYPKTNSYYCFGCGSNGNLYIFIKEYYGLTDKNEIYKKIEVEVSEEIKESINEKKEDYKHILLLTGSQFLFNLLNQNKEKGFLKMKQFDKLMNKKEITLIEFQSILTKIRSA